MHAYIRKGVLYAGVALVCIVPWLGWYLTLEAKPITKSQATADFGNFAASSDVRSTVNWALTTGDHQQKDFIVVDKRSAQIYVFNRFGQLQGATPVLLGEAVGDVSAPGIGLKAIAEVKPAQRITPAGRFIAERGHNLRGEDIVWMDYDSAISIHRVVLSNLSEKRMERLQSPSVGDNRISYGCVNVAPLFYDEYIKPIFASQRAIIYVLPETMSANELFRVPSIQAKNTHSGVVHN